eukprot:TRINITY_DN3854_c0_g1_i1.p3 TRINITY_DN3854_c0_g1~~TRINITY_DN3854_c0_g1_i1.p3  ORF type:complete len:60 (+),score=12.12 TRINITY_DN3854_c0_g1_i1:260-439(+)
MFLATPKTRTGKPTSPPFQLQIPEKSRTHLIENVLKLAYSKKEFEACLVVPKTFLGRET